MTEEEQKAIDIVEDIAFSRGIRQDADGKLEDLKAIKDVFRLVDKQQKEIEELKQDRDEYKEEYIKLQNARYYNYISKDTIKQLLKEKEKQYEIYAGREYSGMGELVAEIKILEKLLEE